MPKPDKSLYGTNGSQLNNVVVVNSESLMQRVSDSLIERLSLSLSRRDTSQQANGLRSGAGTELVNFREVQCAHSGLQQPFTNRITCYDQQIGAIAVASLGV